MYLKMRSRVFQRQGLGNTTTQSAQAIRTTSYCRIGFEVARQCLARLGSKDWGLNLCPLGYDRRGHLCVTSMTSNPQRRDLRYYTFLQVWIEGHPDCAFVEQVMQPMLSHTGQEIRRRVLPCSIIKIF